MECRWFQFHLSTALVLTVAAGALLGVNIKPRLILEMHDMTIGNGSDAVTTHAYFMRNGRGWPWQWDRDSNMEGRVLLDDVGTAVGLLILVAVCCEMWASRAAMQESLRAPQRGISVPFLARLCGVSAIGVLAWFNFVPASMGPIAVCGWPFPMAAFLRADAVIDHGTVKLWNSIQQAWLIYGSMNLLLAIAIVYSMFRAARWYEQRAHRARVPETL